MVDPWTLEGWLRVKPGDQRLWLSHGMLAWPLGRGGGLESEFHCTVQSITPSN